MYAVLSAFLRQYLLDADILHGLKSKPADFEVNMKFDDDDLLHVVETYPPDHPAHLAALRQMMDALPQEMQDRLNREAMEVLGSPAPDGYAVDGQKIWRADTIAESAGVPVADVEKAAKQYEAMFGSVVADEKVTVLKRPEPGYLLSPKGAVILALAEWSDGNEKVRELLGEWFNLALSRGLKPIAIEQLKRVLDTPDWKRKDIDPWLNRIERYSSCSEFVTDIMGITEWAN